MDACASKNFSPEAANLWFASLTKQSFVWRQNYSPYKAKLCKALASHTKLTKLTKLRVQKQSFCKYKLCTSFVKRFGYLRFAQALQASESFLPSKTFGFG
ncbi:hypothetical protein EON73_01795 [bacterium]|nr:MAG: hypothetical protein EON73_01795 [bacterium]